MKQIAALLILITLALVSCHKRTPVVATRTEQPPPPPKKEDAVALAAAAEITAGESIYTTSCVKCHAAKPVGNWTVEQWKPILKSMVRKSKLDSLQTSQVTAYVNAHARKI